MSTKKVAAKPARPGLRRSTPQTGPRRSATSRSSATPAAGKTTLVEALLAATGDDRARRHHRRRHHGERPRPGRGRAAALGRSRRSARCTLGRRRSVNLLDTPGYPDFTGELRAGLRAADAALFVVSAADDIDPITVSLWEECAALGTPRAVVITKLDAPRADYAGHAWPPASASSAAPTARPCCRSTCRSAAVRARHRTGWSGCCPAPSTTTRPASRRSRVGRPRPPTVDIEAARGALIEAIINNSEDETLLERYLAGEDIGLDVLIDDLETAVARGTFYPVLPVCAGDRARAGRAARGARPAASRPPPSCDLPAVTHARRRPGRRRSAATRTARCSPRSCARPSTPTSAGCRSCGSSPARSPRRPRCTSPATAAPSAASRPRRRRAGRPDLLPARRHAAPDRAGDRRRHLRGRPARRRRDRRHASRPRRRRC